MIDIDRVRADTPAVRDLVHFNNAGASLMAKPAFDSMLDYLRLEQSIGGYEAARERAADTARFYAEAARMLNCEASEIAFMESDTRAWLGLFFSLPMAPGSRIVTTRLDYGSHFVSFAQRRREGVETVVVDRDENGDIDLESMRRALADGAALLAMSHIPTGGGVVCDAGAAGRLARDAGVPFILDACQSCGQVPVDVRAIGCTALTATGRKYLRGPRGSGLLYVESSFLEKLEPAQLDQHGAELLDAEHFRLQPGARRFENFEVSYAGRVGLGAAMGYANDLGMADVGERVVALGAYCREALAAVPGVEITDQGRNLCGIVTFAMKKHAPDELQRYLAEHRVNISVSTTDGGSLVDFRARGIDSLARTSVHYFNTEAEIDHMAALLAELG